MREFEFENYYTDPETGERDRPENHGYENWFEVREIKSKGYYRYTVRERDALPYKSEYISGVLLHDYHWNEVARAKTFEQAYAIKDFYESQVIDTHYTKEEQKALFESNRKLFDMLRWRKKQYLMFKDAIRGYQVAPGSWNAKTYIDDRAGFVEKLR